MLNDALKRGQTFPVWVFGTLTVLTLLAFSVNYGNAIYWQLRAQNAADAAAQGAMSVQATRWNAMLGDLHAAAVEEYRLRYIARDLDVITAPNAALVTGCATSGGGPLSCATIYQNLVSQYVAAANRYTSDVQLMQALSTPTFGGDVADIQAAVANFQTNCSSNNGGDCAFNYTVVNPRPRLTALNDVISDCCGDTVGGGLVAPASLNQALQPIEIEVVACAKVKPLFPSALSWVAAPTFTAIGRAASTTIMATQEFMEMGAVVNPVSSTVFQPSEYPESAPIGTGGGPVNGANNDAPLRIDYGGNVTCPLGNCGNPQRVVNPGNGIFNGVIHNQAMDIYTGWWTSIPIAPYSGPLNAGQFTCK